MQEDNGLKIIETYGLLAKKTFEEIFKNNTEAALVNAVRNGMNVYHRIDSKYGEYETFFGAAVRYGTPAVVHACVDMGADVNCFVSIRARRTFPNAETSSLVAAMNAFNAPVLRALLERGARTGVLNGLLWATQKNLFPEFPKSANDENAKNIRQRLDTGAEILKILRKFGFQVPGLGGSHKDMSLYSVHPLSYGSWMCGEEEEDIFGEKYIAREEWYEKDGDDSEDEFDFCEDGMEEEGELSFPVLGTRPGAPWRAVSPEALKLMIDGGADADARSAPGWTAMHIISHNCRDCNPYYNPNAMLQILIDNGADVDARGGRLDMTPLMLAAINAKHFHPKSLETVKLLLKNGADFDAKKDVGAGALGDVWRLNDLRQRIFDEIFLAIYYAAQPDKAKAETAVSLSAADLDLMTAVFWGTADDIAPILARGADVNARTQNGFTALMFASVLNTREVLQLLLAAGADPRDLNALSSIS